MRRLRLSPATPQTTIHCHPGRLEKRLRGRPDCLRVCRGGLNPEISRDTEEFCRPRYQCAHFTLSSDFNYNSPTRSTHHRPPHRLGELKPAAQRRSKIFPHSYRCGLSAKSLSNLIVGRVAFENHHHHLEMPSARLARDEESVRGSTVFDEDGQSEGYANTLPSCGPY